MNARLVALCALLGGCDRVLQLGDIKPAMIHRVAVDYTLRLVENSQTGIAITEMPYDPKLFVVRLPDGTSPPVDHVAAGSYAFDSNSEDYELQLVREQDQYPSRVQHDAHELHLYETRVGRPDRVLPLADSFLDRSGVKAVGTPAVERLYSTGLFTAVDMTGEATIDWTTEASNVGLLDATRNDRLYYAEYDTNQVITYAAALAPVTMRDGATVPITGTPMPVTPRCVHVHAEAGDELAQFAAAHLPTGQPTLDDVSIGALPGDATTAGQKLVLVAANPTTNSDADMYFANPIPETTTAPAMSIGTARPVFAPGASLPFSLQSAFSLVAAPLPPDDGTCMPVALNAGVLGMPTSFALDGIPLAGDDQHLALDPSRDHDVTFDVVSGSLDYYFIQLLEVIEIDRGSFVSYVDQVQSARPSATFHGDLLSLGHTYVVTVVGVLGAPAAAQGDFRTMQSPAGSVFFGSTTFTPTL